MTHVHCVLDTLGYKHTIRICNTCCFSAATMVDRNASPRDVIRTLPFLFCSPPCFICVVNPEEGNTAQEVTPALWACILEVSGCVLSCVVGHTVSHDFLETFLSNARRGPHLGHDSFLTNPFQFIFTNHVTVHACSLRFRENHQAGRKTRRATDRGFLVTFVHLWQVHVGLDVLKYRDRNSTASGT